MTRADIIAFILQMEGGYSDNPSDPGGRTNFGITQRYLNMARAANPSLALPYDVKDLAQSQAAQLIQLDQWTAVHGDELPSGLALQACDTAVNEGPERGIRILQQSVGVTADGIMGPATIAAAQSAGLKICAEFAARRAVAYAQLSTKENQFELGWMRRNITVLLKAVGPV